MMPLDRADETLQLIIQLKDALERVVLSNQYTPGYEKTIEKAEDVLKMAKIYLQERADQ